MRLVVWPGLAHGRVVSAGEAFDAHWRRVLADDSAVNIGCWEQDGQRLVGYWVGRKFWGRALATAALAELAAEISERPRAARPEPTWRPGDEFSRRSPSH
jgi:hypothetical protein